jgi:hypothetical protein
MIKLFQNPDGSFTITSTLTGQVLVSATSEALAIKSLLSAIAALQVEYPSTAGGPVAGGPAGTSTGNGPAGQAVGPTGYIYITNSSNIYFTGVNSAGETTWSESMTPVSQEYGTAAFITNTLPNDTYNIYFLYSDGGTVLASTITF